MTPPSFFSPLRSVSVNPNSGPLKEGVLLARYPRVLVPLTRHHGGSHTLESTLKYPHLEGSSQIPTALTRSGDGICHTGSWKG